MIGGLFCDITEYPQGIIHIYICVPCPMITYILLQDTEVHFTCEDSLNLRGCKIDVPAGSNLEPETD